MDQNDVQEKSNLVQENSINSAEQQTLFNEQSSSTSYDNANNGEAVKEIITEAQEKSINANKPTNMESILNESQPKNINVGQQAYNGGTNQSELSYNQITNLERQMLLNYNTPLNIKALSNWTKVMLTAVAVLIPGLGQIIGIILGLMFVANDRDADRRSYGAALITVSVIAFILAAIYWFIFALAFGPEINYY